MLTPDRIRQRLLAEFHKRRDADGWTMDQLRDLSGLEIQRPTIHKKLHGSLGMSLREAEAIGRALGVRVEVTVRRARRAA